MKKVFTTMLVCMFTCLCSMAQLNIWYNGAVVYQRDYTKIDSITFVIQSVTPPEEVNVSLPGKVERLLGTPDDELRALMISKGYNLVSESANEVGELTLLFVNDNEDSITCGFVQSNLLTDVTAIMHFANSSSPFETYKAWSDTTYHLTAWQRWEAEMKELPQSYSQYFSGRTLFASILNNMSYAAYSAEYYTIEYRGNDASLTFQHEALISRITYKRSFHYLQVPPTSITLPDTIKLRIGNQIEIPYEFQPHGATTSLIFFTIADTTIATIAGSHIIGKSNGTTVLHASCGELHETAVIKCGAKIEDLGMYIIGAATGVASIEATEGKMAQGINEFTKGHREGMYEKYIALEANKDFEIIYYDDLYGDTHYTAPLEMRELVADGPNPTGYFGLLTESTTPMQVLESGLYHVIIDLNLDGVLTNSGGARVVIVPVNWGICGGMNGWSMTVGSMSQFNKQSMTWTCEGVEIPANTEFKFKDEHGWKIFLDGETQQVSAETSLGNGLVPGGNNIKVTSSGIYTITLTWSLAGGGIANSYTYEMTKTADLVLDPATFVVGISGTINAWADPAGQFMANFNVNQSNITDAATKAGTYVFNMESVTFPEAAQFKFRSNDAWLGLSDVTGFTGVTLADDWDNITIAPAGTYDIEITIVWDGEKITSFNAAFTEGTPQELVDITISAIVPAGWEHCYLWAWNGYGNFFQAWPGQELQINNGSVSYSFVNVAAPLNVIFSNGDGALTIDILDVHDGQLIDIATKLK